MLDDRTRRRAAPLKAQLTEARARAAESDRLLDAATSKLARERDETRFRDRFLGGLLGDDPVRAGEYREARRAMRSLSASAAKNDAAVERLAGKLDGVLEPWLRHHDPKYRRLHTSIQQCDDAVRQCVAIQGYVDAAADAARTAVRHARTKSAHRDEEFAVAAGQYQALLKRVKGDMSALTGKITAAENATGHTANRARLPRVAALNSLPAGDIPVAKGGRLNAAVAPLQTFSGQLAASAATVRQWRAQAENARRAAVRAAHDLV